MLFASENSFFLNQPQLLLDIFKNKCISVVVLDLVQMLLVWPHILSPSRAQAGRCAAWIIACRCFVLGLNGRRSYSQAAAVSCQRFLLLTSPPPLGNGLNMMQQPRRRTLSAARLPLTHFHVQVSFMLARPG